MAVQRKRGHSRAANGSGSIWWNERRQCWTGAVVTGQDEKTGKPIRRYVYDKDRNVVQAKMIRLLAEVQAGTARKTRGRVPVLAVVFEDWLEARTRTHSEGTLALQRQLFDTHVKRTLGGKQISALTPTDIDRLLHSLADRLSPATLQNIRATIRACLNWAIRKDRGVSRNVASLSEPIKYQRPEHKTFSEAQVQQLIAAAATDRDGNLWITLVGIGARVSEALGLTWDCFDEDACSLSIRQQLKRGVGPGAGLRLKELKTQSSVRTIRLPETVCKALKAQRWQCDPENGRPAADSLIFLSPTGLRWDRSGVTDCFHAFCKRAGLPSDRRTHDLRHTCATLLLLRGINPVDVSKMLGHSSVTVTLNVYGHSTPDGQKRLAGQMDNIFNGG